MSSTYMSGRELEHGKSPPPKGPYSVCSLLTAPVAQLSKLSAAQARPHVNKAIKARYIIPPCYHILFCLGKKKEWAGQFQTSHNIDILQLVAILYTP